MVSAQATGEFLKRRTPTVVLVISVFLLAGCASNRAMPPLSMANAEPMTKSASLAEAKALNTAFKNNPDDVSIALRFAKSLEAMGSKKEAVAVLAKTADRQPGDKLILAAYGKSLLGAGRPDEAAKVLFRARALDEHDWRVVSALGMAHDQMGRYREARKFYATAVKLAPDEPSIRNNIGLSYALDKDLVSAEEALRFAANMKGAEPRIRQNLALVVGLQGRFEEAKKIASKELPKDLAEQNSAYLRNMLAEPNAWRQLANAEEGPPAADHPHPNSVATAPVHVPRAKPVDASLGGPMISIEPLELAPQTPQSVVMNAPAAMPAPDGTLIKWPTNLFADSLPTEGDQVVVAAKLPAGHRRLKSAGVPE